MESMVLERRVVESGYAGSLLEGVDIQGMGWGGEREEEGREDWMVCMMMFGKQVW